MKSSEGNGVEGHDEDARKTQRDEDMQSDGADADEDMGIHSPRVDEHSDIRGKTANNFHKQIFMG